MFKSVFTFAYICGFWFADGSFYARMWAGFWVGLVLGLAAHFVGQAVEKKSKKP